MCLFNAISAPNHIPFSSAPLVLNLLHKGSILLPVYSVSERITFLGKEEEEYIRLIRFFWMIRVFNSADFSSLSYMYTNSQLPQLKKRKRKASASRDITNSVAPSPAQKKKIIDRY